jgi:hypothetical protein
MPVYSQDLRQRVIDTIERGDGSLRQIAQRGSPESAGRSRRNCDPQGPKPWDADAGLRG